ncbi:MAG: beta-lactamase family protein [Rhodothermaceae bacterium]|nr:beta-lactamase family protein [Rhodothermaceae bacterium]
MNKPVFLILLIGLILGCSTPQAYSQEETADKFQSIIDNYVHSSKDIHGAILHVESPGVDVSWTGASGINDKATESVLTADQPFRMASVTKTYVSAAIFRLLEQQKLNLNDPISQYIKPDHVEILEEDGYDMDAITLGYLLTHTSGLYDYAVANEAYGAEVVANPNKRWTRSDQLKVAVQNGEPQGRPGYQFHYSDTGYILLGEAIESASGMPLAEALRSLLKFDSLGLNHTWLESLEPTPADVPDRMHQYFQGMDTYSWDPSMDLYGGGGLVATASDLAKFYYHLFNGDVFDSSVTLELMTSRGDVPMYAPEASPSEETLKARYRHGLEVKQLFGMTIYAHTGFWGVIGAYIPDIDTAIALAVPNGSIGVPAVMQSLEVVMDLKKEQE